MWWMVGTALAAPPYDGCVDALRALPVDPLPAWIQTKKECDARLIEGAYADAAFLALPEDARLRALVLAIEGSHVGDSAKLLGFEGPPPDGTQRALFPAPEGVTLVLEGVTLRGSTAEVLLREYRDGTQVRLVRREWRKKRGRWQPGAILEAWSM